MMTSGHLASLHLSHVCRFCAPSLRSYSPITLTSTPAPGPLHPLPSLLRTYPKQPSLQPQTAPCPLQAKPLGRTSSELLKGRKTTLAVSTTALGFAVSFKPVITL